MAFLTWAAVAATGVFWALRLFVPGEPTPASSLAVARPAAPTADLSRLLGAAPALPAQGAAPASGASDARFKLIGVVAQTQGAGIALLSIDGKPARAFRAGAPVDGGWVLQQVGPLSATLGPAGGGPALTLSLPPPPGAARGVPSGSGAAAPTAAPQAPGGAARLSTQALPPTAPLPSAPDPAPAAAPADAEAGTSAPALPEGRVPSPEPGVLRRPGPLTR